MTIGEAYTAKRRHITLFGAVAGPLAIKATLRLASGRKVIFRTAFAAGLGLGRIPKPHEFAGIWLSVRGQGDIIGSVRAQILGQALQDTTVCIDRDQIACTRHPGPNSLAFNI